MYVRNEPRRGPSDSPTVSEAPLPEKDQFNQNISEGWQPSTSTHENTRVTAQLIELRLLASLQGALVHTHETGGVADAQPPAHG